MLVLSRRVGEKICIGDGIVVTVVRVLGDKVRIGVEAPPEVAVHREELFRRLQGRHLDRAQEGPPPVAEAATQLDSTPF